MRIRRVPGLAVVMFCAVMLAVGGLTAPSAANSSRVFVGTSNPPGQWVVFADNDGESNDVSVALTPSGYVVTDASATLTVGTRLSRQATAGGLAISTPTGTAAGSRCGAAYLVFPTTRTGGFYEGVSSVRRPADAAAARALLPGAPAAARQSVRRP